MLKIAEYSDEAKYNIKSVSQRTGVQPVTLRAWERRYKILNPQRADNGYRLYSERDIALLAWLKFQVDSGTSISSAVADYQSGLRKGFSPESVINTPAPIPSKHSSLPAAEFVKKIYDALTAHNEPEASNIFEEALASFNLLTLFESVISPVLVEIGEAWYNGKVLVATEHFASAFFRAKLMAIFQSLPTLRHLPYLMIGGAPGELHEIGPLMVAILLREAGYRIEYLGPDLPLEDLVLYAKDERPKMIILSATLKDSIADLSKFEQLTDTIRPRPLFGFGGSAFNRHPDLVKQTPGIFLGQNFSQTLNTVQTILEKKKRASLAG